MAENNLMDAMTQAITQLTHIVEQAHERQERDLMDQDRRLKMMEDVQRDTREMLQILIARSSG
jgi:predicted lysophospholipase L1 biosynthesis ABC-type transport system permease subunit